MLDGCVVSGANLSSVDLSGALLKGVIDETGLLRGGEIFIQIAHARAGHGVGRDAATY